MVKIHFIEHGGQQQHSVDVVPGRSVMEAAVKNGVSGIQADCGGACACATCHVYVDANWKDRTGAPSEMEGEMLEWVDNRSAESRLSCQIKVTNALDGLVVRIPESQS